MYARNDKSTSPGGSEETMISNSEIPIIDLAHMGTEMYPQKSVIKIVSAKLVKAFSEKGVALLVNHGIPDCEMQAVYRCLDAFCELPKESREKYELTPPETRGYKKPEVDEYSMYQESKHEFIMGGGHYQQVMPTEDFSRAFWRLAANMRQLSKMLLTALGVGLEQESEFFVDKHCRLMHEGNDSSMNVLYYPPAAESECGVLDRHYGHKMDCGTFTLIIQDCEVGYELQSVKSKRWNRVGHLPGAILVKAGDALSRWTNEQMPSLQHRIVTPEHCNRGRHTVGFFVQPDMHIVIEPFEAPAPSAAPPEVEICRLQKKKSGVLSAYHHLQRRFREAYAS